MSTIDLNADLGESFGRWTLGDDEAMLDVVTSANVACGFHAGDPRGLLRVCELAADRGVVVGAQVGYRDLAGFGRRFIDIEPADLLADVIYQIGALQGLCSAVGTTVRYVKPHGALYNAVIHHETQAAAVVEAVRRVDPTLPLLGLPGSVLLALAHDAGLPTVTEAFADRAYTADGHPGAPRPRPARCCTTRMPSPTARSGWSSPGRLLRTTGRPSGSTPPPCVSTETRPAPCRWRPPCDERWRRPAPPCAPSSRSRASR